jgi:DNA-binding NarL/FixJ family response regulator
MPQHITAFVNDLIFSTKIMSTGQALGVPVKIARRMTTLSERLAEPGEHLLLVDLDAESENPVEVIRACKKAANPPRVVAFASHVRADLIGAAREAGADQVMARSAFVTRLPGLLAPVGFEQAALTDSAAEETP